MLLTQLSDGFLLEDALDPLLGALEVQPQGLLHGDPAVTEVRGIEDLALGAVLEGVVEADHVILGGLGHVAALVPQGFPHLLEPVRGVDELDLAAPLRRLVVVQHPDVGSDPGVVEHLRGQADDDLQQVVLQDVAPDLRLPTPRPAGEQGRAVEDDPDPGAALPGVAHLADEVHEEQQGAIRLARQARPEAALVALLVVLVPDRLLHLGPVHAEGRVGEHEVEALAGELVIGEGVAVLDVGHLVALDEHVRLADGVGLGVQLLAVEAGADVVRGLLDVRLRLGEEAPRPRCRVIDGDDVVGPELVLLVGEGQGGDQVNNVAGGEVLPRRVVGRLREAPDQLFEDEAHLVVGDRRRAQVDGREVPGELVEQIALIQLVDEVLEVEVLEDLPRIPAEGVHIDGEVLPGQRIRQGGQGHRGVVVEGQTGRLEELLLLDGGGQLLGLLGLLQDLTLGGLQNAFQAAQHREGEDDPAVLTPLEVSTEQLSDVPDEFRVGTGVFHGGSFRWRGPVQPQGGDAGPCLRW